MKNQWKPVLIVGGLLIVLLTAIVQSNAAPSASPQLTALPHITATLPLPTETPYASPTPKGARPPQCTFPLTSSTAQETPAPSPSLDDLTFSEPQVVLTSTTPLNLIDWLPDNETLLITRRLPDSARESIETYNLRTGQSKTYAVQDGGALPLWIPDLQAVAYRTSVLTSDGRAVDHDELWLSYGFSKQQRLSATDGIIYYPALIGKKLVYFSSTSNTRLQVLDLAAGRRESLPVDLAPYLYSKYPQLSSMFSTPAFLIAPNPQGPWDAYDDSSLLFLANRVTGEVCEVDLGVENGSPLGAYYLQWSPDGRYLAMLTTTAFPGQLIRQNYVSVLDMSTGTIQQTDMGTLLYAIEWYPNTHILTAMLEDGESGRSQMSLYLIDVWRERKRPALPGMIFSGSSGKRLTWSSDGRRVAMKCPLWPEDQLWIVEDRICVSSVSQQP